MTGKQIIAQYLRTLRFAPGDTDALLDEGLLMPSVPMQTDPYTWSPAGILVVDQLLEKKREAFMGGKIEPRTWTPKEIRQDRRAVFNERSDR